ncbi:DUF1501 domain-containing protein [Psychromarinibacter sp. C21-152]|uniref:DUF1501 domain-containing protein n=1 Tax=Psychromarinibacter sediminicola TaxID=3033385 RepID=A0AAE3NKY8_9RHOB|nr:DUF1501 domain-containing protein [Psychromarinibacter sediminicola]MDF0599173.1 DUF1501 domain-containing protein [Psychromarinibacter sediminicola]
MATGISRRGLLKGGLGAACSLAAHPLTSTMTMAAAPWDARLVVIVLRGAMDGLGLLPPLGEPDFARYRPALGARAAETAIPLDGMFGLHRAMAPLMPLWRAGELGFAQAVSTPYRDKRSHFDGQDLLEAGTGMDVALAAQRDGWLNRLLQAVPGTEAQTAFAVGRQEMRILRGDAPVYQWEPETDIEVTAQQQLLLEHVYAADPLFSAAAGEALELAARIDRQDLPPLSTGARREPLGAFAADRLLEDTRIVSYSLTGWDTHRRQKGALARALDDLQRSILSLREGLGPVWSKTAVLAMTEFGRTVAENGSAGTDHGTGGAMVMAGGALRGGRIYGDWPGLAEADLYDRRDLMPTGDVRAYAAWAMRGLYGLDRATLEGAIFPTLDMGADPGMVA